MKAGLRWCVWGMLVGTTLARADVSGHVYQRLKGGKQGAPIAGAEVRVQADPASAVVITDANGAFTLPRSGVGVVVVAAAVPYNHAAAVNYVSNTNEFLNGDTQASILLPVLAAHAPSGYTPLAAQTCGNCHVNQYSQWLGSRHAHSAGNAWMRDLYDGAGSGTGAGSTGSAGYVFTLTHAAENTGSCATCHAPMEDVFMPGQVRINQLSTQHGQDGVSCVGCHQIAEVDAGNINALHHQGKTAYRFPEQGETATGLHVFGPLPDVGAEVMANIYSPLFRNARLCAACHQYVNPSNGIPGQNTYAEWLASPYAVPGPNFRTCMDCHMPPADGPGTIAIIGNVQRPADQRRNHQIVGSNPESLNRAILLRAQGAVVGNEAIITLEVENRGAGHSFPAGFTIRNGLLVVEARVGSSVLTQTAGPTVPAWANDDVAGVQPGDFGGLPGTGFTKILRGRINGQGPQVDQLPIFLDGEQVLEDSTLPSGQTRSIELRFAVPSGTQASQVHFDARLIWRRAYRALAVTKGWSVAPNGGPIEIEVQRIRASAASLFANGFE